MRLLHFTYQNPRLILVTAQAFGTPGLFHFCTLLAAWQREKLILNWSSFTLWPCHNSSDLLFFGMSHPIYAHSRRLKRAETPPFESRAQKPFQTTQVPQTLCPQTTANRNNLVSGEPGGFHPPPCAIPRLRQGGRLCRTCPRQTHKAWVALS